MMTDTKEPQTAAKPKKAAAKPKTAAKAPAAKAPAAKKTTTSTKKPAAARKTKSTSTSPEQRYKMIEVAAFYLAEKDGFAGNPVDYWIAAELQISNQ